MTNTVRQLPGNDVGLGSVASRGDVLGANRGHGEHVVDGTNVVGNRTVVDEEIGKWKRGWEDMGQSNLASATANAKYRVGKC